MEQRLLLDRIDVGGDDLAVDRVTRRPSRFSRTPQMPAPPWPDDAAMGAGPATDAAVLLGLREERGDDANGPGGRGGATAAGNGQDRHEQMASRSSVGPPDARGQCPPARVGGPVRNWPAWPRASRMPPGSEIHVMHDSEPGLHPLEHLLDLARAAVRAAVEGRPAPEPDLRAHPELEHPGDAFVTLTEREELRGCMGTLDADLPVGRAVVRAAGLAATRDPRFWPVAADELDRLRIEVSVLTPSRPLDSPDAFVPGRDGIVAEARGRRALLLPQVATEMGWGTTEMLDACCEKAGLPADAWRDRGTRLLVFEVRRVAGPVLVSVASAPA